MSDPEPSGPHPSPGRRERQSATEDSAVSAAAVVASVGLPPQLAPATGGVKKHENFSFVLMDSATPKTQHQEIEDQRHSANFERDSAAQSKANLRQSGREGRESRPRSVCDPQRGLVFRFEESDGWGDDMAASQHRNTDEPRPKGPSQRMSTGLQVTLEQPSTASVVTSTPLATNYTSVNTAQESQLLPSGASETMASPIGLHLAAVSSLKNEVLELSARLHAAHRDRDSAREALCAAQGECGRLRNTLALQARSSEERMTELHGVIAELRRLCSARDRAAIQELREEDSEVETSCRDNSVTGASDRTTSLGDADETASVHNDQAPETPTSLAALPVPEFPPTQHPQQSQQLSQQLYTPSPHPLADSSAPETPTSPAALPVPEFPPAQQPQQSQQLSQQLYTPSPHPDTDTSNRNLAPADSTSFDEEETIEIDRRLRCRRRPSPRSPRRNNTGEQSPREPQQQQDQRHPHDREEDEQLQQRFPSLALSRQHSPCVRSGVIPSTSPQTKIASRVRLRRTHEDARLTGKDICQEGVYSSAVAEHLTRGSTSHCEEEGEGEERLNARLDRLEADNMLLAVTLRESKEHADRLSLACAQCSAEAGALRMALAAADRAVEAYDVLLALAETSEHTQDGLGSGNTVRMRVATERVARGLLARLDGEAHGQLRAEAVGPWADPAAMLLYQCDNDGSAWTPGEEERLRGHVSRLKRERTVAASGAQPAQWPLLDDGDGIDDNLSGAARGSDKMRCLDAADARKLDMETAVLMQEVMSLREERAELRARLRSLRPPGTRQTNSLSGAEEGESERRLLEALARENTLKTRLQRLMASVNQANCNMDNNEEVKKCPRCGTQPGRNIPWEEVQLERTVGEDPPALAPPVVASEQMNDGVAYESQTTTHQL